MQMMNNLHPLVIPTPFPVGPVNVYLLDGPEPALVDAGPNTDEAMAALQKELNAHGYTLSDIRHLIITHAHSDHYGLAARIVARSGAAVYSHGYNLPILANDRVEAGQRQAYYAHVLQQAGVPLPVLAGVQKSRSTLARYRQATAVDVALDDGDVLTLGETSWQVIHTPGHARGHICLYHRESGRLLSGDHLLRDISSNPLLEPPLPGETERPHSLAMYQRSLKRVAALDVTIAWTGHGQPITDHRSLVDQRLRFHRQRAGAIAAILARGPQTVFQIATALFAKLSGVRVFLAVSEVIGHLDLLVETGEVALQQKNGVARYARVDSPSG